MDYSLLVGVNDEKKELVVGIVGEFLLQSLPFVDIEFLLKPKKWVRFHWSIYVVQET